MTQHELPVNLKRGVSGRLVPVHPTDHGDSVPALLSPAACRTDMMLIARIGGRDFELGSMTLDVPVRPDKEHPLLWEVADIEPTLAAALREVADAIDSGESS